MWGNDIDVDEDMVNDDMDEEQYNIVKKNISDSINTQGKKKSELEKLIKANLTGIDKKIYADSTYIPSPQSDPEYEVTKEIIDNNDRNFTRVFLKMVDEIYKSSKPKLKSRDIGSYLFTPIKNIFYENAGHYQRYEPINRLYFLFLCNLYCNSLEYYTSYLWLAELLFIFEQLGLTGIFYINKYLFGKLFSNCPKKIEGRMDEEPGRGVALCNSSLNKLAEERKERIARLVLAKKERRKKEEQKNTCRYGDTCERRNAEHREQFHSKTQQSRTQQYTAPTIGKSNATKSMKRGGKKHSRKHKTRKNRKTRKHGKTRKLRKTHKLRKTIKRK
jgi:hypothetical protein